MGRKDKKQNKKAKKEKMPVDMFHEGVSYLSSRSFFSFLDIYAYDISKSKMGGDFASKVSFGGIIDVNNEMWLKPDEWAYILVHQQLHICFGHFDAERMTGVNALPTNPINAEMWNLACDIYVYRFMKHFKCGICPFSCPEVLERYQEEREIYEYLMENGISDTDRAKVASMRKMVRMKGIEKPKVYDDGEENEDMKEFAEALVDSAVRAVTNGDVEDIGKCSKRTKRQKEWFIGHYPLLGGVAAGFDIVEDRKLCQRDEIKIAAVNAEERIIYLNPDARLSDGELRFVLAHEMLHAGLDHYGRCQGRNHYLWNIACDFVINDWLYELQVGDMPEDVLYEEKYHGLSAESIYDILLQDMRNSLKLMTLRGYGKGDFSGMGDKYGDDFFKEALAMGLEYHNGQGRGYLPAGLIEEIRALSMPVIPWDLKLAEWFQIHFPELERQRSYARPSRRQSSTPDIPIPGKADRTRFVELRTFGVVVDTSGSMDNKMLGKALGSIASLANAREVTYVRVVFCDAAAYDIGYISPDDIAGRVEVKGRGGTKLQPAVTLLEEAEDFPKDGAILIITDGEIEDHISIHRDHAYLIPRSGRLPFRTKGEIFYFQ